MYFFNEVHAAPDLTIGIMGFDCWVSWECQGWGARLKLPWERERTRFWGFLLRSCHGCQTLHSKTFESRHLIPNIWLRSQTFEPEKLEPGHLNPDTWIQTFEPGHLNMYKNLNPEKFELSGLKYPYFNVQVQISLGSSVSGSNVLESNVGNQMSRSQMSRNQVSGSPCHLFYCLAI